MTKTIITPVGISIFTNYMKKSDVVRKYPALSREYESIEVQVERLDKLAHTERQNSRFESDINYIKQRIKYLWLAEAKENACAELQTLAKIAETEQTDLDIQLLATDTVQSVVACELIQEWLDENPLMHSHKVICSYHYNTHVVSGLQVEDATLFKTEGFQNLLILIQKFKKPADTIINISGGYKALVPFVTLFAQLEEIPLKYLYEDSEALLTVGNLPFNFDFTFFTDEYAAFESIKPAIDIKNLPSKAKFIENLSQPEAYQRIEEALLIFEKEDTIHLSELGKILYTRYEENDREDGFSTANLLGKVMEVKVFEFFQKQFPKALTILGKGIGKSKEGDAYDLDVFVENDDMIWAIEVKPQNIKVLMDDTLKASKNKETIEYKCSTGAFYSTNEQYANKQCHIAVVMYHHLEPGKHQVENFIKLKARYDYFRWIWLQPPSNYKGNVNWAITIDKFKEFNFKSKQWINVKL